MKKKLNKRFNRFETKKPERRHAYIKDFTGISHKNSFQYQGYIKCKLLHTKGLSVISPDQLYLELGDELLWFQPFFFSPNIIHFLENESICRLPIDISCGLRIWVEFKSGNLLSKLKDDSLFYRCEIEAPKYLYRYATGQARIDNNEPAIQLFHHTSKDAATSIRNSKEFWSSAWNIQGTKALTNIAYLYLTSLPKIRCDGDLIEIAMSSNETYPLRLDNNATNRPDLVLKVYRSTSSAREETLSCWVKSAELAPQPIYRHWNGVVSYEIVCQFIHRIGVEPKSTVKNEGQFISPNMPKKFNYCVIGDATSISGLQAPLDEECPEHIFKIQHLEGDEDIFSFWLNNQNSEQFTGKDVELVEIETN